LVRVENRINGLPASTQRIATNCKNGHLSDMGTWLACMGEPVIIARRMLSKCLRLSRFVIDVCIDNSCHPCFCYVRINRCRQPIAIEVINGGCASCPSLGQYVPLFEMVTPVPVRDVATQYFAPENQPIVVGEPKAVGEQRKAFGDFTVTDK
jgi:hypothetical protein